VVALVSSQDQSERSKQGYTPSSFMPDAKALDAYYKSLTDQELLKLRAEGGFTAEAEQKFGKELARRGLTSDEAKREYAPEWLDDDLPVPGRRQLASLFPPLR
jgi:hypothetical protein